MHIVECSNAKHAALWRQFVDNTPQSTGYHRWEWKGVIERTFNFPTFYLMAMEAGSPVGILPLALQKSWLTASCLCSVPFLSSGGIVAANKNAEQLLFERAITLVKQLEAERLELRNVSSQDLGLIARKDKITLLLPVYDDSAKTWASLDTKMRTKIRRAQKFGLTAEFGKDNLLDEFYAVFAENMRDLGTPVYGRKFFADILQSLPESTHLCVVRHEARAVAAAFLIGFRDTIEAKWSSSIRRYRSLKPNMFLYWELLAFAGGSGYRVFDFGRSSVGSGTHEFKLQWGAKAVPLHWSYWSPTGAETAQANPQSPKYKIPIWVWQKLPLSITNQFGPRLVKQFPS